MCFLFKNRKVRFNIPNILVALCVISYIWWLKLKSLLSVINKRRAIYSFCLTSTNGNCYIDVGMLSVPSFSDYEENIFSSFYHNVI